MMDYSKIKRGIELVKSWVEEMLPILEEIFGSKTQHNVIEVTEEFLNIEKLVKIARGNAVEGADSLCAFLRRNDKFDNVYIAYLHDMELLPEDKNKYINIKAGDISRDIVDLFGKDELIILK